MTTAGHDPDDWFDEPDASDAWTTRVERLTRERQAQAAAPPAEVDDWIRDSAPSTERESRGFHVGRPVVLLVVLALALLFGILAAAGAFSGGKHATAPTLPTVTTPTTTASTKTTTTRAPTIVVPTTTLKPGDTGTAVKQLQRALAAAGYSPGAADGNYGNGTQQAVTRFQQAHSLTADGIAGSQTLAALASALQSG